MEYFAIYIPSKNENGDSQGNVFTQKADALQLLKKHKDARLKAFKTKQEASIFVMSGAQSVSITGLKSPSSLPIQGEKSIHRSLSPQELVLFRKEIEQNHLSDVYQMVMENPRYLVNIAANMPTILKEGPRYNALHCAILSKHTNMCKLILQTIEKPQFIELLNGPQNDVNIQEASMILIESYLNMPNKPRQETPLHFAAKLGLRDIIELLLSYPLCKQKPNSEGCLPKDVICQRCPDATPELKKSIADLLQEQFFVPVIRSTDNSTAPVIGELFCGPNLPTIAAQSRLSPKMEVVAVAGPMDKEQAQNFRRRWKTPPRVGSTVKSPVSTPHSNGNFPSTPIRRQLFEDQNGNTSESPLPAVKFFREYRDDFHDSIASDCSNVSFDDLDSPAVKERHVRLRDPDKGVETVGRELAKSACIGWKEYWKFLGRFVDLSSTEGLGQLEAYLKSKENTSTPDADECISELVDGFNTLNLKEAFTPRSKSMDTLRYLADLRVPEVIQKTNNNITNPNLSIEKALQVYAKRAAFNISRATNAIEALETELKKLKTIVLSYCEDNRFLAVNFKRAHARYARLIRYYTDNEQNLKKLKSVGTSEEVTCIIMHIFSNEISANPNLIGGEQDCITEWEKESECECQFLKTDRSRLIRRRRDFRLNLHKNQHLDDEWAAREPEDEYFSCDSEIESDQFSDAETENSVYETPPESPTDFESVYENSDEWLNDELEELSYNNYIEGSSPTKVDADVLNAIHHLRIDENSYPHIAKWKEAVEREFPVKLHNVATGTPKGNAFSQHI